MNELLLLKQGEEYFHFRDDKYTLGSLKKASVFSLDDLAIVKNKKSHLEQAGLKNILLRKILISEEPYEEDCP